MSTARVLFILKQRQHGPYGSWNYSVDGYPLASGLSVSATQVTYVLDELGIDNKLVQVIDNNCIDREVTAYRPTHVIIEAFWVVPEKFDILRKLHPNVKWIIRNHSKSDFLSHEGGMVGWAIDYVSRGLTLACNSPEATADFRRLAISVGADPHLVVYLPNYYRAPLPVIKKRCTLVWRFLRHIGISGGTLVGDHREELKIGCFGAIRPLKNHLHQAMAAIEIADALNKSLRFYINSNRVEGKAEPILTSLRQLFKRYPHHTLVEIGWLDHDAFTDIVRSMDVVMQVSNSETFNIVSADAVSMGVPIVVSDEIPWIGDEYHANPNDVKDIAHRLLHVLLNGGNGQLQADQLWSLHEYTELSKQLWKHFITRGEEHGPLHLHHWSVHD